MKYLNGFVLIKNIQIAEHKQSVDFKNEQVNKYAIEALSSGVVAAEGILDAHLVMQDEFASSHLNIGDVVYFNANHVIKAILPDSDIVFYIPFKQIKFIK